MVAIGVCFCGNIYSDILPMTCRYFILIKPFSLSMRNWLVAGLLLILLLLAGPAARAQVPRLASSEHFIRR